MNRREIIQFALLAIIGFSVIHYGFEFYYRSRHLKCRGDEVPCLNPTELQKNPEFYLNQEIKVRGKIIFIKAEKIGNRYYRTWRLEDARLFKDGYITVQGWHTWYEDEPLWDPPDNVYGICWGDWKYDSTLGYYLQEFSISWG